MQTSVHHDLPFPVQAHSWERLNLQIIHSFECMWWTEQSPGHVVIKRTSVETGLNMPPVEMSECMSHRLENQPSCICQPHWATVITLIISQKFLTFVQRLTLHKAF